MVCKFDLNNAVILKTVRRKSFHLCSLKKNRHWESSEEPVAAVQARGDSGLD